jgi:hypothetical protein
MLILVPIILLLLLAVLINLLGRYKLAIGSTWLITAGSAILVWIVLIIFRIVMPSGVTISNWSPLGVGTDLFVFKLSTQTWIFAFLLVTLLIGVVFTDTIRLGQGNNLTVWSGSMILTAVGLFSIFSQTLLAVIITWSIIDIVEFGLLLGVISHPRVHTATILEFSTRILGTAIIFGALIFSNFHSAIIEKDIYPQAVYIMILLGATLRLGILPLHVPLTANLPVRRSLGTMLRFVAPLSVFSFLTQIQSQPQYGSIIAFFLPFVVLTAIYGGVKWFIAKNELIGRPYWMLAFSGLVLISFLRGHVEGLIALSITMIVCGGVVFFHSYSSRLITGLGIFCFLGVLGLPFTPDEPQWSGLIITGHPLSNILLVITVSLLFLGFLKHLFRKTEKPTNKEIWMQLFYSLGLGLLAIFPWVTMIWRFQVIKTNLNWSPPIICLGSVVMLFFISRSGFVQRLSYKPALQRFFTPVNLAGKWISAFFQFDWFFNLLHLLYDLIARLVRFFNNILEGDGGLLWALLFLGLISSVLIGKILP